MLEKEDAGFLEPIAVDSLPSQPGAAVDLLPPGDRSAQTEAKANQGQRFIDDDVRGDERLPRFEALSRASQQWVCTGSNASAQATHPAVSTTSALIGQGQETRPNRSERNH